MTIIITTVEQAQRDINMIREVTHQNVDLMYNISHGFAVTVDNKRITKFMSPTEFGNMLKEVRQNAITLARMTQNEIDVSVIIFPTKSDWINYANS